MSDFSTDPVPWQQDARATVVRLPVKRGKIIGLATMFSIFALIAFLTIFMGTASSVFEPIMATMFFGGFAAALGWAGVKLKYALELGPNGIRMHNGALVAWDNIQAIEAADQGRHKALLVTLVDPDAYLRSLPKSNPRIEALNRDLLRRSRKLTGHDIQINLGLSQLSVPEVVDAVVAAADSYGQPLIIGQSGTLRSDLKALDDALDGKPLPLPEAEGGWPQLPKGNVDDRPEPVDEPWT